MDEKKQARPGILRRILGDILIAAGLFLTADVTVVMLHRIRTVVLKDDYRTVFRYELIICAVLLLFALDVRFGFWTRLRNTAAKCIGWVLRIAVCLLTAVTVFFCGRVIHGSLTRSSGAADRAIVLGMALENGQPTDDLIARLDTAQAFLNSRPDSVLILTGGNADASGRTEAAVMRDLLTARGAAESRLLLEDKAQTTKENFRNTAEMIDPNAPVMLISSNYHMDRAVTTAKKAGFTNILRNPAPSGLLSFGANMLSEVVLDLNEIGK